MPKGPPIAPGDPDDEGTVYIVLDDFGELGRAYRETAEDEADERTIIHKFLTGQYERPVRVAAFNTDDRSSCDVSEDIAHAVAERASNEGRHLSEGTRSFLETYLSQVALPTDEQ
jgi:predicted DNA binding CopG/RHH family protein